MAKLILLAIALILTTLFGCDVDETTEPIDPGADADVIGGDADAGADGGVDAICLAMPVCDPGHEEVDSEADCLQDDAVCYSNTLCGTTIWCTGPDAPELRFLSGGYQFGECGGACRFEVALIEGELNLSIRDWGSEEPVHQANAELTEDGVSELEAILGDLTDVALDETYGCPDCADGGATHVTLLRGADESTHTWETGNPPVVLEAVDAFIEDSIEDISDCTSTDLLEPTEDCGPFE